MKSRFVNSQRMVFVAATSVLLLALGACGDSESDSAGDEYPDGPVTLIVPFSAGGAADSTARALVEELDDSFPDGIQVVNRDGGGGVVGMSEVIQADADGQTIGLVGHTTMGLSPHLVEGMSYDTPDDYTAVSQIAYAPMLLVTQADAPWEDIDEFIEAASASDGSLKAGSAGNGTPSHILFENFQESFDLEMNHVPFEGDAPAITALLGGNIDAVIQTPGAIMGNVEAGDLQVLGTFEPERNELFPDAPSVRELGQDIVFTSNFGVYAPNDLPENVTVYLEEEFKTAVDSEGFQTFADTQHFVPAYLDSAEMTEQLQEDYEYFGEMVDSLDITSD